jgi:hypothetical protein
MPRAIFDSNVVAEWSRRREEFRHSNRWAWWALWIAVLLSPFPLLLGWVGFVPYAFVGAFLFLFFGLHLRFRHMHILACPHCGKAPVPRFQRLPLYEVDCCPHCNYWLIALRKGSVNA